MLLLLINEFKIYNKGRVDFDIVLKLKRFIYDDKTSLKKPNIHP